MSSGDFILDFAVLQLAVGFFLVDFFFSGVYLFIKKLFLFRMELLVGQKKL